MPYAAWLENPDFAVRMPLLFPVETYGFLPAGKFTTPLMAFPPGSPSVLCYNSMPQPCMSSRALSSESTPCRFLIGANSRFLSTS